MSGCSNNALSHNNRVANRTVLALGETGLLTGCRDRGINDHGVTGCICICVFIAVSARACMCGVSILGARRRCDHCGVFIGFNAAGYNINDHFFFTAITCRAFCNSYRHHSVSRTKYFKLKFEDYAISFNVLHLRQVNPNSCFPYTPSIHYNSVICIICKADILKLRFII